jgi:hypothetical protein
VLLDDEARDKFEERWESRANEPWRDEPTPVPERRRARLPKVEEPTGWEGLDTSWQGHYGFMRQDNSREGQEKR